MNSKNIKDMKRLGSRAEVWHGNATMTAGGLIKKDLFKDKYGNLKSRKASSAAKKNQNLGEKLIKKGSSKFILGGKRKDKGLFSLL